MPRVLETVVYRIDELEDGAKEKAREWWRGGFDDDWHERVIDDFCRICSILGVQLKTTSRSLYGGGTREEPSVWFRGFWSQGDGACFEGRYTYQPKAPQRIRDHAPTDGDLHAIADQLFAAQRRNFYQLYADIRHRGRYCHSHSMDISVRRDSPTGQECSREAEEEIAEAMRDIADWLFSALEREYAYQTSDPVVDEVLSINGYTFTAEGRRFG